MPSPPAAGAALEALRDARALLAGAGSAPSPAVLAGARALLRPLDLPEARDALELLDQAGRSPAAGALVRAAVALLGARLEGDAASASRTRAG